MLPSRCDRLALATNLLGLIDCLKSDVAHNRAKLQDGFDAPFRICTDPKTC